MEYKNIRASRHYMSEIHACKNTTFATSFTMTKQYKNILYPKELEGLTCKVVS